MITYDTAGAPGAGQNIVLLHSTVCDRRMWDAQWRALAEAGHHVLRGDFRGFGDTPCTGEPYNDADDVLALMDAVGMDRAVLVGASYGGRTALEIAVRAPGRVAALVLLCAGLPGVPESPELTAFEEREVELVERGDLVEASFLVARTFLGPEADEATLKAVAAMQEQAYEIQLAGADDNWGDGDFDPGVLLDLEVPALVVSGAHDLPDFHEAADRQTALLPLAHREHLPWAGHLPGLERPEEITALLTGFLAETARRAG
ncbi:alpha/beta fold hydrolase [Streptomyces qinzhouensis]|uniref:Alpha/beta fold hydrolase n=1 Tax=Streptomyces qinzhouensis TaxID=2599401 RepID=A0A5B8JLM8_9ACTN|nr:alpha/beta hydrolase [Streptomyces qinzhouensis]QDY78640.1 alpha/beta fold hydrolase [Streptomyces qinzhouensis]